MTEPLITKTGRVLTDADIEALADEAERGYDVEGLRDKPNRIPVTRRLIVFVPATTAVFSRRLVPGSAIVGGAINYGVDDRIVVDYEGNKYGAENMRRYEDKLLHAAGRHVEQYPTIARMTPRRSELVVVGFYNHDEHVFTVTNRAELERWVPGDQL